MREMGAQKGRGGPAERPVPTKSRQSGRSAPCLTHTEKPRPAMVGAVRLGPDREHRPYGFLSRRTG
jgi:hypothetical protein